MSAPDLQLVPYWRRIEEAEARRIIRELPLRACKGTPSGSVWFFRDHGTTANPSSDPMLVRDWKAERPEGLQLWRTKVALPC